MERWWGGGGVITRGCWFNGLSKRNRPFAERRHYDKWTESPGVFIAEIIVKEWRTKCQFESTQTHTRMFVRDLTMRARLSTLNESINKQATSKYPCRHFEYPRLGICVWLFKRELILLLDGIPLSQSWKLFMSVFSISWPILRPDLFMLRGIALVRKYTPLIVVYRASDLLDSFIQIIYFA